MFFIITTRRHRREYSQRTTRGALAAIRLP